MTVYEDTHTHITAALLNEKLDFKLHEVKKCYVVLVLHKAKSLCWFSFKFKGNAKRYFKL